MTASDLRALARLQALKELGVDVYAARRPLPGARGTRVFAMPKALVEGAASVPGESSQRRPAQPAIRDVALSSVPDSPAPPPTARTVSPPVTAGVRFRCQAATWTWPQSVLIIADIEGFADNRARMQALARLVADVRRSVDLRADDSSVQFSRFDWPVANAPLTDSSLRRAAEVFDGFLRQRLSDHAVTAVIVLGDNPASLLAAAVESEALAVPSVTGPSPAELFADAAGKIELWRALQPLRHPGRP